MDTQSIIICGSMSHYEEMVHCQQFLVKHNIASIVPEVEGETIKRSSPRDRAIFRREASKKYFRQIRAKNVFAILVVNAKKNGIPNYIGANTFAEIAMAFCWQ